MSLLRHLAPAFAARSLRTYFVALFLLTLLCTYAGAELIDRSLVRDARQSARDDALYSARTAADQLGESLALLRQTPAQLAANPQIGQVLVNPAGCTLSFQGIGGPDRGHLDILRADGTVACSSRPDPARLPGYGRTDWLTRALREPLLRVPRRDAGSGTPVAVASSPLPGGKGAVAAFADLTALGPHLAEQYGGGRDTVFLVTAAGGTSVVGRSLRPERWIGTTLERGRISDEPGSEAVDLDGVERIYSSAAVPGTNWRVYVGERESSVLATAQGMRARQRALLAGAFTLLLLVGAVAYRKTVVPIRRLSGAVRASSRLATPMPVEAAGPVELRELAEDVNALVVGVHAELHERRRAEAAMKESERGYRLLFESNPSAMWVYDPQSLRVMAVNDAAIDQYGYSREEFLGLTIEDIRTPDERERLHRMIDGRPGGAGLHHAGLWRHRRKDGTEFDAEIHSHDHTFQGRPARVVMAFDVTERAAAERALRTSEARYRELFQNASDLIATVDLAGRLTDANDALVRALGYPRDELVGSQLRDHVPPDSHPLLEAALEQKLGGGEPVLYEHELLARDGRRIHVEVASRLIVVDGEPVGLEAICRDVTERRQLEEQLRQAQRLEAIGRLAGGVAHDFNNLLTVISGYAQMLLADGVGRDHELEQIAGAADRATILTRQLLAFSRRQVLQARVLDLNGVVQNLTPMLERLIGEDVHLSARLSPNLDQVLADPTQVEQILLNLAVNARDAMPTGGRLTIQTANVDLDESYVASHGDASPGPHVVLSVSDTGSGMDSDTLSHIFEPFFTTKPIGTGTGLGLATVYGIVKQSGGSIWVYSEPGAGTTFKIYLPRSQARVEEAVAAQAPRLVAGSETILLAEDEATLRGLTARMLARHGYDVIAAETAAEALRIVEEGDRPIDLLLTDLIMPELSGGDLARSVRRLSPNIRVLFMSGYADDIVLRNGQLAPDAPFLEKPFNAYDLAAKVREALDVEAA